METFFLTYTAIGIVTTCIFFLGFESKGFREWEGSNSSFLDNLGAAILAGLFWPWTIYTVAVVWLSRDKDQHF
jgi:hypothetical protein